MADHQQRIQLGVTSRLREQYDILSGINEKCFLDIQVCVALHNGKLHGYLILTWKIMQERYKEVIGNWLKYYVFSAANLALAGFPLTKTLGENLPSRL